MSKSLQKQNQKITVQTPQLKGKGVTAPVVEVKPFNVNDYAIDGVSKD